MKCSGESSLDAKEIIEQRPELGHKNRSVVIDNRVQEAMMLYHYVNHYFRQSWSINNDLDYLVMNYFGQAIDNNKN